MPTWATVSWDASTSVSLWANERSIRSFKGGAIFIHIFGAYFGIAVSLVMRKRDYLAAESLEGSKYQSDVWAMIGTVILWIFWPSFNAILAGEDAFHRAVMNTYISLLASTVSTFIITSFFGE